MHITNASFFFFSQKPLLLQLGLFGVCFFGSSFTVGSDIFLMGANVFKHIS